MLRKTAALFVSVFLVWSGASARVWDVDEVIRTEPGMAKRARGTSAAVVQEIAGRLRAGDALRLSRRIPLGKVRFENVPDDIELSGGFDGEIHGAGRMRDWDFIYCGNNTAFYAHPGSDLEGTTFFCSFNGKIFYSRASGYYESAALGLAPRLSERAGQAKAGGDDPIAAPFNRRYDINPFSSKHWMPMYYVDGAAEPDDKREFQVNLSGGTGGKWYFAIEAQQASRIGVLKMDGCRQAQLYSGSTEGCSFQLGGTYEMHNCEQTVLGMRRFYSNHRPASGWKGAPLNGLIIKGGNGNILHNLIDISNPRNYSMISEDAGLQMWQTFLEDTAAYEPSTFNARIS